MIWEGNWWGVNNAWADEMAQYPYLKKLFLSKDPKKIEWLNEYIDNGNINTFFLNIDIINISAILYWGGEELNELSREYAQSHA